MLGVRKQRDPMNFGQGQNFLVLVSSPLPSAFRSNNVSTSPPLQFPQSQEKMKNTNFLRFKTLEFFKNIIQGNLTKRKYKITKYEDPYFNMTNPYPIMAMDTQGKPCPL
jgi:hypothetical protein